MAKLHFPVLMLLVATFLFLGFSIPTEAKINELNSNKTPKVANIFTDACDECQQIITKLVEVAKDPVKVAELKSILSLLCRETSYETECRLFVSKIDLFLEKLLPYLRDPHWVCKELHICSNTKLSQFHNVGMIFAKKYTNQADGARDLICEECQFAAHELLDLVDDKKYQQDVDEWLSDNVCAHMGQFRGSCDLVLSQVLPQLWTELHDLLQDNKKFCVDIELCDPSQVGIVATSNATSSNTQEVKVSKRVMATLFN